MAAPLPPAAAIHSVRPLRPFGPNLAFASGAVVRFHLATGPVRARVIDIDHKARLDLPLGTPYRLSVRVAPPSSGYEVGRECTIRSGCLEVDPDVEQPPATVQAAPVLSAPAAKPAPASPLFLVAFMREGGTMPVQGALLVAGATLEAASAAAMQQLNAELEADVRERGESAEAMVLLLNASEVPPSMNAPGVISSVTW